MAGQTNFPTSLDDNSSLHDVSDGVSTLQAAHHNNMKEAIKAVQAKVGIDFTSVPTSLDYRIGNPTGGHRHDGASGQGQAIPATAIAGLATYLDAAGIGGFTPVAVVLEKIDIYHAPPNAGLYITYPDVYSHGWVDGPTSALPTALGLAVATNNEFRATEDGIWAVNVGATIPTTIGTWGGLVSLHLFYPGAWGDGQVIPTSGGSPEFIAHRVIPMASGDTFGVHVQNGHASATAPNAIEYTAMDIVRLANRLDPGF